MTTLANDIYMTTTKKGANIYIDLRNACAIERSQNTESVFVYPPRRNCLSHDDFGGLDIPLNFGGGWKPVTEADVNKAKAAPWNKRLALCGED